MKMGKELEQDGDDGTDDEKEMKIWRWRWKDVKKSVKAKKEDWED